MFHLISDDESDDQEENLFFITHLTPHPPRISFKPMPKYRWQSHNTRRRGKDVAMGR